MIWLKDLHERLNREFIEVESNPDLTTEEKVQRVIQIGAAGCAGIAATPIPIADFFVLTPVQGYMGYKIARIRGVDISEQDASEIVRELLGTVGLGLIARQIAASFLKFVPIFGSIANIPIVYGLTYAIGKAMDFYFRERAAGRVPGRERMQEIFREARDVGERTGQAWAKTQSSLSEHEQNITDAFMQAKDAFVGEARRAFEEIYGNFREAVEASAAKKAAPKPRAKAGAAKAKTGARAKAGTAARGKKPAATRGKSSAARQGTTAKRGAKPARGGNGKGKGAPAKKTTPAKTRTASKSKTTPRGNSGATRPSPGRRD
ncbi:hypothetical protein K8I61_00090 [bacterium]|nr:hypothetical protein [bacterium]